MLEKIAFGLTTLVWLTTSPHSGELSGSCYDSYTKRFGPLDLMIQELDPSFAIDGASLSIPYWSRQHMIVIWGTGPILVCTPIHAMRRPMFELESFFLRNSWPLQDSKYILCTSFLSPFDEVEHRHEDDSIFKFFCTCLTNCNSVLNLLENLQCRVSWENVPLELNWFSINSN